MTDTTLTTAERDSLRDTIRAAIRQARGERQELGLLRADARATLDEIARSGPLSWDDEQEARGLLAGTRDQYDSLADREVARRAASIWYRQRRERAAAAVREAQRRAINEQFGREARMAVDAAMSRHPGAERAKVSMYGEGPLAIYLVDVLGAHGRRLGRERFEASDMATSP